MAQANSDGGGLGLFEHQSEHASFRIITPTTNIRLTHGRYSLSLRPFNPLVSVNSLCVGKFRLLSSLLAPGTTAIGRLIVTLYITAAVPVIRCFYLFLAGFTSPPCVILPTSTTCPTTGPGK